MPWQQNLRFLLNRPVGVSLMNGQGVSGVLCSFDNENIYLMQYLYRTQFATMHYAYSEIQNVMPFPNCYNGGTLY